MRFRVERLPFRFPAGFVLALSPEQARDRLHRLAPRADGFEVLTPVEFKAGEIVDIVAGDLGRAWVGRLEPLDPEPAAKRSRRKRR